MKTLSLRGRLLLSFSALLGLPIAVQGWLYLSGSMALSALALVSVILIVLLISGLALHWCLVPLRRVSRDIEAVRSGERKYLATNYPPELLPLTNDLNAFIELSDDRLKRYRKRLDDLAHSFKTPLAVQRAAVESETDDAELRRIIVAQIERMDQSVKYHLKRAATQGQLSIGKVIYIQSAAQKIRKALGLKYATKDLSFDIAIEPQLRFPGPAGDLLEVLGNLGDNACKAARNKVIFSAHETQQQLVIQVEDDGPGIAPEKRNQVLQRGRRGEGYAEGSGIGLALVNDIAAEGYKGRVEIDDSALGGACVRVILMKIL